MKNIGHFWPPRGGWCATPAASGFRPRRGKASPASMALGGHLASDLPGLDLRAGSALLRRTM